MADKTFWLKSFMFIQSNTCAATPPYTGQTGSRNVDTILPATLLLRSPGDWRMPTRSECTTPCSSTSTVTSLARNIKNAVNNSNCANKAINYRIKSPITKIYCSFVDALLWWLSPSNSGSSWAVLCLTTSLYRPLQPEIFASRKTSVCILNYGTHGYVNW